MKRFAFVSDFDGTLTSRDFYHIIIDKYLKEWGREFYTEWKRTKRINVEFLNKIFSSMDKDEAEINEEIFQIPFDETARTFIQKVKENGGDFYVLSAGTSYYINILFKHLGITDVQVISMDAVYENRGLRIVPDPTSKYYSEIFGLDKRKALEEIKQNYEAVFFAGDSEPDLEAAKVADMAFARGELMEMLKKDNLNYVYYNNFGEIQEYLKQKGVIK